MDSDWLSGVRLLGSDFPMPLTKPFTPDQARAAGITPILIAREGDSPAGAVRSLAELIPLAGT